MGKSGEKLKTETENNFYDLIIKKLNDKIIELNNKIEEQKNYILKLTKELEKKNKGE